MTKMTFGTDPEFMLVDDKKGPISAIGIVPGTKEHRHKVGKHEFYYDNVTAECTVAPGRDKEEVIGNLKSCLTEYAKLVSPYKLAAISAYEFPRSQLNHDDAFKIGCKRELCAYELTEPEPPIEMYMTSGLRVAGGHIHIGQELAKDEITCLEMVRMFDLFLGVPSIFLDNSTSAKQRKTIYGQAGRFRKPSHGVEYRSLSNFWLQSPKLTSLIFDIAEFTVDFIKEGKQREFWSIDIDRLNDDEAWDEEDFDPANCHVCHGYDVSTLRKAVDEADANAAQPFMEMLTQIMPSELCDSIHSATETQYGSLYEEWEIAC